MKHSGCSVSRPGKTHGNRRMAAARDGNRRGLAHELGSGARPAIRVIEGRQPEMSMAITVGATRDADGGGAPTRYVDGGGVSRLLVAVVDRLAMLLAEEWLVC